MDRQELQKTAILYGIGNGVEYGLIHYSVINKDIMKHIISLVTIFLIIQCVSQPKAQSYNIYNNPIKDSIMFEKFDYDLDANNYAGYKPVKNSRQLYGSHGFYQLKNGGVFSPERDKNGAYYFVIPPTPNFYSLNYIYYTNGNLRMKGKLAGFHGEIPIGIWQEYDEIGRMTEVDEDKKFGLWTFEKVLERLDKDEVINLETGKNREANRLRFSFNKDKKIWTVKVFKKEKNQYVEEYWEYLFDGNTGKHSREWYEEYNDDIKGMMGEGMPMPPLKNSKKNKQKRVTEVYRTHNGKSYTQSEWEAFEEKQYEEYCKKTGRPYTPKSQDTKTEKLVNKSPFIADEDDVKPEKKKGFLGGLFG